MIFCVVRLGKFWLQGFVKFGNFDVIGCKAFCNLAILLVSCRRHESTDRLKLVSD